MNYSTYSGVVYTCDACDVEIRGHSSDPQEAPWLYCPECNEEMGLEVNWR